jgi:outer membrane receptor for ferrienterochelin and colicin
MKKFLILTLCIPMLINLKVVAQIAKGQISGRIIDITNQAPLTNVNVAISGTQYGSASDNHGWYFINNLSPGVYQLQFKMMGYKTVVKSNIKIFAHQTTQLDIAMSPEVVPLQEIIVTPGQYSLAQSQAVKGQAFSDEEISHLPASLDDICRVVQMIPGITASNDFSAHFHVRGGEHDENLILLDGIEIFDPYHLKDVGGAIGIVNMDVIENVQVLTGGFTTQFGDKLSSVVQINTKEGSRRIGGNIGIGGTGVKTLIQGPLPYGSWFFTYRKSFLKEAVKFLNPPCTISPSYYDLQGKLNFQLTPDQKLTFNLLHSSDHNYLEKWKTQNHLKSDYGNFYISVVWKNIISPGLLSEMIYSRGENFWDNKIEDDKETLHLVESVLQHKIDYQISTRHNFVTGLAYKHIRYNYRTQFNTVPPPNFESLIKGLTDTSSIKPTTYKLGFFLQERWQATSRLMIHSGIRFDYFDYNNDFQFNPRFGFAYYFNDRFVLRTGWGYYSQSPNYTELTAKKGDRFNPTAEKSVHYTVGIENNINNRHTIHLEIYYKKLQDMIGHYIENETELKYGNPYHGYCKGVEVFFKTTFGTKFTAWLTYAYSIAKIQETVVNFESQSIVRELCYRYTDQPHNLTCSLNLNLANRWSINLKWRYLSGIPYTPCFPVYENRGTSEQKAIDIRSGKYHSSRFPAYHRLDLRVMKTFIFPKFRLESFLEIKNVYNQKNVLLYDYEIGESGKFHKIAYYTLPFIPSLEFCFHF